MKTPLEWSQVRQIAESRRSGRSPIIDMCLDVQQQYGGDYVLPNPTGADDDPTPLISPALVMQAIDQPALRAASVLPGIMVPPIKKSDLAINRSLTTRGALEATWQDSWLPLGLRRSFRHLRAYNTACFVVEADYDLKQPKILVRDPLTAFPEERAPEDMSLPKNCAFIYGKSSTWLRAYYPQCQQELGGTVPAPENTAIDEMWDLLEWVDEDQLLIGILGPRLTTQPSSWRNSGPLETDMLLDIFENRSGCCPVVCPSMVTLDQIASQVAKIIGSVKLQAQILGLEIAAIQKSIWPDKFLIGKDASPPQIVSGSGLWQSGETGQMNVLENVSQVGELRASPDGSAARIRDELEQNTRGAVGLIPAQNGQVSGSSRTGRGLDALVGVAIDPGIQEIQEIMGFALESVNEACLETYKGHWGSRRFSMFTGAEFVEFTPTKDFETTKSRVTYAIVGADRQQTTVTVGQLVGAELMSHKTAREKHPDIDNPAMEGRQIIEEKMDQALMVSILNRLQSPGDPNAMTPEQAALVRVKLREGETLDQAYLHVHQEMQAKQAAAHQDPSAVDPAQLQPGIAAPGESGMPPPPPAGLNPGDPTHDAQAPGNGIQGPTNDLNNLRLLTGAMNQTSKVPA